MAKKKLWNDLKKAKANFGNGRWCFMGDFNAVSNRSKRKGFGNYNGTQEIREFRNFINEMELIDPPLLGRKFTWYRADCWL